MKAKLSELIDMVMNAINSVKDPERINAAQEAADELNGFTLTTEFLSTEAQAEIFHAFAKALGVDLEIEVDAVEEVLAETGDDELVEAETGDDEDKCQS